MQTLNSGGIIIAIYKSPIMKFSREHVDKITILLPSSFADAYLQLASS